VIEALVILCICLAWTAGYFLGNSRSKEPPRIIYRESEPHIVYVDRPAPQPAKYEIVITDDGSIYRVYNPKMARYIGPVIYDNGSGWKDSQGRI